MIDILAEWFRIPKIFWHIGYKIKQDQKRYIETLSSRLVYNKSKEEEGEKRREKRKEMEMKRWGGEGKEWGLE